jgi:hypothetical protein
MLFTTPSGNAGTEGWLSYLGAEGDTMKDKHTENPVRQLNEGLSCRTVTMLNALPVGVETRPEQCYEYFDYTGFILRGEVVHGTFRKS